MALSSQAFAELLQQLGSTPEAAGQRYEQLRQRLLYFFSVRHHPHADEHADEVIDRLARRLAEGAPVSPSLEAFALGIARNLEREQWKKPHTVDLPWHLPDKATAEEISPALECLEKCLALLDEPSRRSILRFYRAEGAVKIRQRQALAEELGIDANALRVRMHRLRARLEKCVSECQGCNESPKGAIQ